MPKRSFSKISRPATKAPLKRPSYKRRKATTQNVQSMIKKALAVNIETKSCVNTSVDGVEILHNNFQTLTDQMLYTTQGLQDPATTVTQSRIGDKITLRGVSIKMMLELNERFSDVTFRIMVIKAARGDVPTRANLFVGLTGNKMLDNFNKERYTLLAQKYVKMTAPNQSTVGGFVVPIAMGVNAANDAVQTMSRATRIVKMWIPGKKIARNGVIQYDNGGYQPKFFDYHVVVYAYSHYSNSQDIYTVGRINDYIQQLYYRDA